MITAAHPAISLAWLAASVLFILSLKGLSSQATARQGNVWGVVGMSMAVLATIAALVFSREQAGVSGSALGLLGLVIAIGCAVGALLASRVAMTAMPELVAVLHSFVGLAAVLVGFANYLAPEAAVTGDLAELGRAVASVAPGHGVHLGEIYIGVYNADHHWYYFPRMRTDEVVIIKCFDSMTDGRARYSGHGAARLTTPPPPGALPRESIEIRTVAFL